MAANYANDKVGGYVTYTHRERIRELKELEPGDHISWKRKLGYEHHAILVRVDLRKKEITFIENTSSFVLGWVQERVEKIEDLTKVELYQYHYRRNFDAKVVIARAKSKIGKWEYNFFRNNCEHFATWCKTGEQFCSQFEPSKYGNLDKTGYAGIEFVPEDEELAMKAFQELERQGRH